MKIGSPAERAAESRVALTPESAKQLQKLGHECIIRKELARRPVSLMRIIEKRVLKS